LFTGYRLAKLNFQKSTENDHGNNEKYSYRLADILEVKTFDILSLSKGDVTPALNL